MRKLKRLASALLALVMAFGLTCTAFATSGSYTININDNATDGYQYTAYQIFDGDVETDPSDPTALVLTNITWGSDITTDATQLAALYAALATIYDEVNNIYPFTSDQTSAGDPLTSAADVAAALEDYEDDDTVVQDFAETVKSYITGTGTTSGTTSPYSITVSNSGYYLIETTTVPSGGAYTRYILAVADETTNTANDKSDVPTVDKAVSDLDASIGDTVTYYLAATLPTNYADYTTYMLTFDDTLSSGLTYTADSVSVKVFESQDDYLAYLAEQGVPGVTAGSGSSTNYTEVGSGYDVDDTGVSPAGTLSIVINNTNALYDNNNPSSLIAVDADSVIAVEFTATLNENAVIGGDGNSNSVILTYSNNPNSGYSTSTGTTVADVVYTWTYQLQATKVDEDGEGLAGASFQLYRIQSGTTDTKEYAVIDSDGKISSWTTTVADGTTLTSNSDGYIVVTGATYTAIGLDQGTYYLTETVAPTGYNELDDAVEIVITASYTQETATGLTTDYTSIDTLTATADGESATTAIEPGTSGGTDGGLISNIEIENKKGSPLPSTGGIGTTIFYVVGGVLVIGAVVLLITKRRMGDD